MNYITSDGLKKLKDSLTKLIEEDAPKAAKEIALASQFGDLSENAEYHAAKEKQEMINVKMASLRKKISKAIEVDISKISGDTVQFGARVDLIDLGTDTEVSYKIVGQDESDIRSGLISISSPLASSLIGKKAKDIVEFKAPSGIKEYEIVSISYGNK